MIVFLKTNGIQIIFIRKKSFQFKLNVKGGSTWDVNYFFKADTDKH